MTAATASAPIRTALVGLGRIGFLFHGPALQKDSRYALVGVSDPLPERRQDAEIAWSVPSFAELDEMLKAVKPSLVVLASPTLFHASQAAAAFAAGADVLCEKPVASSLAELEGMIATAQRAGRRLVPYQPRRYDADVRAVKRVLQSGRLGPVHLIQRARCNFVRRSDWQAFRRHGGGMLNNYGSHCLDEFLWLLDGDAIASVSCRMGCIATLGDAEDFVHATLTAESGLLIDLHISQAAAINPPAWLVHGARGAARYLEEQQQLETRYFSPTDVAPIIPQTGLAADGRQYQTEQLPWQTEQWSLRGEPRYDYYDALWRHLVLNDAPPVSLAEARALFTLIERCRRSAETGAPA